MMLHHRERACQNRELINDSADMTACLREMEELAQERAIKTAHRLAEMERLRSELESLRGTGAAPAQMAMEVTDEVEGCSTGNGSGGP